MFAAQRLGVRADMITCAKGLTNGAVPMGAVLLGPAIVDAFMQGPPAEIDLFHGYTYSGHPVACAAALAAIGIYEREGLPQRAASLAPVIADAAHALRGLPGVVDIRNFGLIAAVELADEPGRAPTRAFEVFRRCFEHGLLVRATGNVIALSPPLIVTEPELAAMFTTLAAAIRATP
jgi:beta-alanine--pyruvate transaminase